mgnify:CR=1 FL=1
MRNRRNVFFGRNEDKKAVSSGYGLFVCNKIGRGERI